MKTVSDAGICRIALLVALFAMRPGVAQETDDIGPAVDTSAMTDVAEDVSDSADADTPPPETSADVTRTTSGSRVMDSMTLDRIEITGNQELPKVLYIVPWQKPDPGDLMGKPVNTLIDEVLAPIDREEFVRQVNYYDDLYGEDD